MIYEVGRNYGFALGHAEGCYFDMADDAAAIMVFMERPSENEKEQMSENHYVKYAMLPYENVIMMLFKFGRLEWMDAPYTPHLSKNLTKLQTISDGLGYATHILLFDTQTGKLVGQRLLGMPTDFSNRLADEVMRIRKNPFDINKFNNDIQKAYRYTTDQLVTLAGKTY